VTEREVHSNHKNIILAEYDGLVADVLKRLTNQCLFSSCHFINSEDEDEYLGE